MTTLISQTNLCLAFINMPTFPSQLSMKTVLKVTKKSFNLRHFHCFIMAKLKM